MGKGKVQLPSSFDFNNFFLNWRSGELNVKFCVKVLGNSALLISSTVDETTSPKSIIFI